MRGRFLQDFADQIIGGENCPFFYPAARRTHEVRFSRHGLGVDQQSNRPRQWTNTARTAKRG